MANFLWSVHGEARTRWINWSSICCPTAERGFGIRSLEQIKDASHAKLLWMVMVDHSLWARYMRTKYGDVIMENAAGSPLWKAILIHFTTLQSISRWIVGSGERRFWLDNWVDMVWNSQLPFRLNAFAWRVLNSALPVDQNIKAKGIFLVSKCICCRNGAEETLAHLLLHSDRAIEVWKDFANIFGKPTIFNSLQHLLVSCGCMDGA